MARAYDVLRKLENGELLRVASRSDLEQAQQLAESLNAYWPAEYIVELSAPQRDSGQDEKRLADRPQGVQKPETIM